jgi:hypothetical protein
MNWRTFFTPNTWVSFLAIALLAGGVTQTQFESRRVMGGPGYELTPGFFRFATMGHWTAAVDYLWIRTLQVTGGIQKRSPEIQELARFYRLAQKLDPGFFETYTQAAVVFGVVLDEPDLALEVLDRGIAVYESGQYPKNFWSRAYLLYLYRAYVNAFEKENFREARRDFQRTSKMPGAPAYLALGGSKFDSPDADRRIAVHVLRYMVQTEKDPEIRKKYEEKLKRYER